MVRGHCLVRGVRKRTVSQLRNCVTAILSTIVPLYQIWQVCPNIEQAASLLLGTKGSLRMHQVSLLTTINMDSEFYRIVIAIISMRRAY